MDSKPVSKIISQTIDEILATRPTTHGDFSSMAELENRLLDLLSLSRGQQELPHEVACGIRYVVIKLARINCGDPTFKDHWLDIAGYATLVAQKLSRLEVETSHGAETATRPESSMLKTTLTKK